jgi:hypothetical protein
MKTIIISRTCLSILALLLLSNSYAQKIALNTSYNNSDFGINTMDISSLEKIIDNKKIESRILKYVNKHFKNTDDISWEQADENLIATVHNHGATTKYLFNKNGRIVYTIQSFSAELVPADIKKMMLKYYRKYTITSASKIVESNRHVWVVKIDGKKSFATVRIEDGEIEEIEKFDKQIN